MWIWVLCCVILSSPIIRRMNYVPWDITGIGSLSQDQSYHRKCNLGNRFSLQDGKEILQPCHELTAFLLLCDQPRLALTLTEGGIIGVLCIGNRHGQE